MNASKATMAADGIRYSEGAAYFEEKNGGDAEKCFSLR